MVSTRNISRSNVNRPKMQDQPGDVESRPPAALETMQANTDEVEALHLTNQRLIGELEQLTRQMQRPQEVRPTQEGHNITPHEGPPHLGAPRGAETEAESSRVRGHGPQPTPGEEGNKAKLGGHVGNQELNPPSARNRRMIMGAEVQGPPTGTQPHEGSCERPNSSLHVRPGTTNRISIHHRGASLPPSGKIQNAADRDVRRNKRLHRPPQYKQKSNGTARISGAQ